MKIIRLLHVFFSVFLLINITIFSSERLPVPNLAEKRVAFEERALDEGVQRKEGAYRLRKSRALSEFDLSDRVARRLAVSPKTQASARKRYQRFLDSVEQEDLIEEEDLLRRELALQFDKVFDDEFASRAYARLRGLVSIIDQSNLNVDEKEIFEEKINQVREALSTGYSFTYDVDTFDSEELQKNCINLWDDYKKRQQELTRVRFKIANAERKLGQLLFEKFNVGSLQKKGSSARTDAMMRAQEIDLEIKREETSLGRLERQKESDVAALNRSLKRFVNISVELYLQLKEGCFLEVINSAKKIDTTLNADNLGTIPSIYRYQVEDDDAVQRYLPQNTISRDLPKKRRSSQSEDGSAKCGCCVIM